jgi:hypothetical protein
MQIERIEEGDFWHYCEYCFKPCAIFCGCQKEKEELEKLKNKNK